MPRARLVFMTVFLLAFTLISRAELRLPHLLSDHAVLQRDAPIHIWGWGDPGEQVTVAFHAQKLAATTDSLGHWSLWLSPEAAGGPYSLTVTGASSPALTRSDLLVGDVWFASGQSNMEFPLNGFPGSATMKNGAEEIAHATQPRLRLLLVDRVGSPHPLDDLTGTWTLCLPETAAKFSAVAYLFGREISAKEDVAIGLIDSTWGGTPASSWISAESVAAEPAFSPLLAAAADMSDMQLDEPARIAAEKKQDAEAKAAGQPAPKHSWHPNPVSWIPSSLYNGMVAPATPYSIKGVIWYQGESDSMEGRANLYERAFTTMITDWRARWAEGNFPFLYVQISSFTSTPVEQWGILRDAQRRALKLADTAMAVTLDVGEPDNVHPSDKQSVAARLALAARATVYGEKVEYSGPAFRQATVEGSGMRVWFDHAAGLRARPVVSSGPAGSRLGDFEVAGADRHFYPAADARIDSATVLVSSPQVAHPAYVRYAWPNAPAALLENAAGLPASTFTSESNSAPCVVAFPGDCAR